MSSFLDSTSSSRSFRFDSISFTLVMALSNAACAEAALDLRGWRGVRFDLECRARGFDVPHLALDPPDLAVSVLQYQEFFNRIEHVSKFTHAQGTVRVRGKSMLARWASLSYTQDQPVMKTRV